MAPPEGRTPVHTMKRTGRSPWTTLARNSGAATTPTAAQTLKKNPIEIMDDVLPARIVSDIVDTGAGTRAVSSPAVVSTPTAPAIKQKTLASSSKITALQREWEKKRQQQTEHNNSKGDDSGFSGPSSADEGPEGEVQELTGALQPPGGLSNSVKHRQANAGSKKTKVGQLRELPIDFSSPDPNSGLEELGDTERGVVNEGPRTKEQAQAKAEAKRQRKQQLKEAAKAKREAEREVQRYSEDSILKQLEKAMPTSKTKVIGASGVKPKQSSLYSDQRSRPFLTSSMLVELKRREMMENANSDTDNTVTDTGDEGDLKDGSSLDAASNEDPKMLLHATDGRSYYLYKDAEGNKQNTNGAPFPPGYERYDGPMRPFICPVRDCRALSHNMKSMSSHFHGRHSGSLLNDNGDGTLSKIGTYTNKEGTSPGIVVTQNPLPPDAPPAPTPIYTPALKQKLGMVDGQNTKARAPSPLVKPTDHSKRPLEADNSFAGDVAPKRPRVTPVPAPSVTPVHPPLTSQGGRMPTTELLQYLHKILSPEQKVPDREDIRALASFKRLRKLPSSWIAFHKDKILEPQIYACALAYLVGEEVKGSKACEKGLKLARMCRPCVSLPSGLSSQARAAFSETPSCVGCRYYRIWSQQGNQCDWNPENQKHIDKLNKGGLTAENEDGGDRDHESPTRPTLESESEQDDKESEPKLESEKGDKSIVQSGTLNRRQSRSTRLPQGLEAPSSVASPVIGQFSIADLEMESWEFAPGTFKDETTNENIGFSGAYLLSGHPVTVSPDIGFNVLTLNFGATHTWPALKNKIRTCSVASGKVKVKIGGQEPKKMGTHSAWVIKPGQTCTIENWLYINAVIHCHTVQDYELISEGE